MKKLIMINIVLFQTMFAGVANAGPMSACRTLKAQNLVQAVAVPNNSTAELSSFPIAIQLETLSCPGLSGQREIQGITVNVSQNLSDELKWERLEIIGLNSRHEITYQEHAFVGTLSVADSVVRPVLSKDTKRIILRFARFKQLSIGL